MLSAMVQFFKEIRVFLFGEEERMGKQ